MNRHFMIGRCMVQLQWTSWSTMNSRLTVLLWTLITRSSCQHDDWWHRRSSMQKHETCTPVGPTIAFVLFNTVFLYEHQSSFNYLTTKFILYESYGSYPKDFFWAPSHTTVSSLVLLHQPVTLKQWHLNVTTCYHPVTVDWQQEGSERHNLLPSSDSWLATREEQSGRDSWLTGKNEDPARQHDDFTRYCVNCYHPVTLKQ